MFKEIQKESIAEREERILKFWSERRIFERSVEEREGAPSFVFYDGPPFATGLPHYGHILAGTIKDVVPRYKTMKGFCVPRRFGWDCHGLPVEQEIEKEKNLSGAKSIEEFGIANFNEECRKIVLRYTKEWEQIVKRMGRFVDFKNVYRTMDITFMESVWWVFKQLYEKGLVYQGYKVMPYSAKLGTPLSNFEAGENYKEVDDPSLAVAFPLKKDPSTRLVIWTTTPWTLVSNLAVMAGPEIDYVTLHDLEDGKNYIMAKSAIPTYYPNEAKYRVVKTEKGKELEGLCYTPLFPYFQDRDKAFRVILEENIATDEGTGLVHCAPAFGEVDFYAAKRAGIELVCPVDENGHFTAEIPEYAGLFVKDADKAIIKRLKQEGKVVHSGTCHHRYPFCWRSDTPLIYKVVSTFFVGVEQFKDRLLEANKQIYWTPGFIKEGRFGKWLEGARDWAISRNRHWGTPIPIWKAEDGEWLVIGSIKELEELSGEKVHDLHRHFLDSIVIRKDGKQFRRTSEVFDCWFESGSMPYAQNHYPFENKDKFEKNFPADFIGEGLDQTRCWFYVLTILSVALFDKPAFRNVIVNGIVLAEDGQKMSKRLKNYPDPMKVVSQYGADAVRLYLLHSPAVRAEDLRFSERGVELVLRQILIPFWNAYSFFLTYARIYNWKPLGKKFVPKESVDKWMLSKLHKLIHDVEEGMDAFVLSQAVEPFVDFVEELTNWYIRRNRRRFWSAEASESRDLAFATLYHVLLELTKVAAPFVPFLSDAIYQNLRSPDMLESVHLELFPQYEENCRDKELESAMSAAQRAVSLGHSLRKEHKIKVRQPLATAHVVSANSELLEFLKREKYLIEEELNVKNVIFSSHEEEFVSLKAKPNFRVLGKKVGKAMRAVQKEVDAFPRSHLIKLLNGGTVTILAEGESFTLSSEDVEVERAVKEGMLAANEGEITVVLNTTLTEHLLQEGLAREIVNKINTMRRDADFDVTDRVKIRMETTKRLEESYRLFQDYIAEEVLALEVVFGPCEGIEWDLNGEPAKISLIRVPKE